MAKADDLLDEIRNGASLTAEALHRKFLDLDMEIIEGRPPASWSLSKLSKSNTETEEEPVNEVKVLESAASLNVRVSWEGGYELECSDTIRDLHDDGYRIVRS